MKTVLISIYDIVVIYKCYRFVFYAFFYNVAHEICQSYWSVIAFMSGTRRSEIRAVM